MLIKPDPEQTAPAPNAPNATAAAPSSAPMEGAAKVAVVPSATDDARTQTTLMSLVTQAGWFPELKVSVKNGIVRIQGKTKDTQHLEWLAKTADRLPTVVAVINQAEIETPPVSDLTPAWNEFKRLIERSKRALPRVVIALVLGTLFFFLGRVLAKHIYKLWSFRIKNLFLLSTVARLTMLPIWVLFFYVALQAAGLSNLATPIIGGTGALGVILGFAFKDIGENYLSGILLAIRAPFTKGDEIQVGETSGFVQSLNMRGTTIIDSDGNLVLIPNSTVIQSIIRNKSVNTKVRGSFNLSIAYTDSASRAQTIIKNIIKALPGVLSEPEPMIVVEKLTNSTVNLKAVYWYDTKTGSQDRINSSALVQSKDALLAEDFALPYSSQEFVLGDEIKVRLLEGAIDAREAQTKQETRNLGAQRHLEESREQECDTSPEHEEEIKRIGGSSDLLDRGQNKNEAHP